MPKKVKDDGRMGLPSGSFLPRLRLCLGSWNASQNISDKDRKRIEAGNADANEGRLRHKLIEDFLKDYKSLEAIDPDYHEICKSTKRLLNDAREQLGFRAENTEIHQETRLPLRDSKLNIISTGQFDYLETCDALEACILADWKTLFNEHTAPQLNYQLIQYACQVMQKYKWIKTFYLVLIQPNLVEKKQLQIAEFSRDDLEYYLDEILDTYAACGIDTAPRVAGPVQCEYCMDRFSCKECLAAGLSLTAHPLDGDGVDPELLFKLQKAQKLLKEIVEEYESRATASLTHDPESVDGYYLSKGRRSAKVSDTRKAWELLSQLFDAEDFNKCCKMSVTDATQVLYDKLNDDGHKIAKDQCKANIEKALVQSGLLEVSHGQRQLKRR